MGVACIILNYNDADNTSSLINKVKDYSSIEHIIVVDNCSTDDSLRMLSFLESEKIHIYKAAKNGGYGAGNNLGIKCAAKYDCDYALIANPDVYFSNKLVSVYSEFLNNNLEYGVVSGIQLDKNGIEVKRTAWKIPTKWQHIFSTETILRRFGEKYYYPLEELHKNNIVNVECVAGALLMVSIPKFIKCGGFDEEMFLYYEETVLGIRMKEMFFKSAIISNVTYKHMHGATIQKNVSSNIKRKKMLINSHRILLEKYLGANKFEIFMNWLISRIALLEEFIKIFIN